MEKLLSQLADDCSNILKSNPGPEGRVQVANLLAELLADAENIETLIPDTTGERDLLFENTDLGFCILAHQYKGPKSSPPHDHGESWAIYAQARGETEMTDYELVSAASADTPGKVRATKTYRLTPGDVHVYDEGDLHSPTREGPTSLLRIEGMDLSKVKRLRYEAVA
ncbi:MAG: hypothetical protein HRU27_02500 [Rhizobiaceae bacterium]|nr:hypothetical protein [Hyphomicrobiales bacterium]NRB29450.1 hypothetical protein [Rhizobiaceae bacterium]